MNRKCWELRLAYGRVNKYLSDEWKLWLSFLFILSADIIPERSEGLFETYTVSEGSLGVVIQIS